MEKQNIITPEKICELCIVYRICKIKRQGCELLKIYRFLYHSYCTLTIKYKNKLENKNDWKKVYTKFDKEVDDFYNKDIEELEKYYESKNTLIIKDGEIEKIPEDQNNISNIIFKDSEDIEERYIEHTVEELEKEVEETKDFERACEIGLIIPIDELINNIELFESNLKKFDNKSNQITFEDYPIKSLNDIKKSFKADKKSEIVNAVKAEVLKVKTNNKIKIVEEVKLILCQNCKYALHKGSNIFCVLDLDRRAITNKNKCSFYDEVII